MTLKLVLVIPFVQLWRVQISLRQKFILGTSLSLSIFMIIIAIIRISKTHIDNPNLMWMTFWHQFEASIAVIMVSSSAFRSFFVTRESRRREIQNRHLHWYMSKKNRVAATAAKQWRKFRSKDEEMNQLPEIPRGTMTGMRTFIREAGTEE